MVYSYHFQFCLRLPMVQVVHVFLEFHNSLTLYLWKLMLGFFGEVLKNEEFLVVTC